MGNSRYMSSDDGNFSDESHLLDELIGEVRALRAVQAAVAIRPGDTLVLTIEAGRNMSLREWHRVKAQVEADLPGVKVVALEGVTGLATYRDTR